MSHNRKRTIVVLSLAATVGVLAVATNPAVAQSVKDLIVRLQDTTPGTKQTGHLNISGTAIAGQFVGGGAGLTGVDASMLGGNAASFYRNASNINAGTLADGRLSNNVGLLTGAQTFTGAKQFTNINNSFTGNGSDLTGLNASNIAAGTVADARLSNNVGLLNGTQIFTGAKSFSNLSNSFTGNGSGLTNLAAANLTGEINDNRLSNNVGLLTGAQTFTGAKTFANFTMSTGATANTVLLGDASGKSSWGKVGNAQLAFDSNSLDKVTNNNWEITSGDLENIDGQEIKLFSSDILRVFLDPRAEGEDAGYVATYGANGNYNAALTFVVGSPNHGGIGVWDQVGDLQAVMVVNSDGDGVVSADVKNFVVPHPLDPQYDIVYTCIEGPEAAMYTRGTAQLMNGQAHISLPEHFALLASTNGMTVTLTPKSRDSLGLGYDSASPTGFSVFELGHGEGNYAFDWEIKAVRKAHEGDKPVRPWDSNLLAGPSRSQAWNARLRSFAARQSRLNSP